MDSSTTLTSSTSSLAQTSPRTPQSRSMTNLIDSQIAQSPYTSFSSRKSQSRHSSYSSSNPQSPRSPRQSIRPRFEGPTLHQTRAAYQPQRLPLASPLYRLEISNVADEGSRLFLECCMPTRILQDATDTVLRALYPECISTDHLKTPCEHDATHGTQPGSSASATDHTHI